MTRSYIIEARKLKARIKEASDFLLCAAAEPYAPKYVNFLIDQAVRVLQGDKYEKFVRAAKRGENGPDTYAWYTGEE